MKNNVLVTISVTVILTLVVVLSTLYLSGNLNNDKKIADNTSISEKSSSVKETISSEINTYGVKMISIYMPCTNCDDPDYEKIVVNVNSANEINSVMKKLETKSGEVVDGIGFEGSELMMKIYYSTSVDTVLILGEDQVVIGNDSNENEKIYNLKSNSNIKTYISNLYKSKNN